MGNTAAKCTEVKVKAKEKYDQLISGKEKEEEVHEAHHESHAEMQKRQEEEAVAAKARKRMSISMTGFKGEMVDEKKHGAGTFTYEDGATYTGEWHRDKAHGTGTYKTTHAVYVGEWYEDLKNGVGEETYNDDGGGQTVYKGDFHQGHRHGRGVLMWPDGTMFDGEFEQNNLQGTGVFKFKNGQKYSGQVSDNSINGAGRYEWPDGTYYEGQYKMGMKHGDGHFMLKNGNTMKCHWRDGKPYGPVAFKAKELLPPTLDWYEGVMVTWATRSEEGTPRSKAHNKDKGLFSSRGTMQARTPSKASNGSGSAR